jgi:surface carbohydrate biosynthesis protein (TIGR04326 family)
MALGFLWIFRFGWQAVQARFALGSFRNRRPHQNAFLMVGVFPAVDAALAEKGIFRHRMFPRLQDTLEKNVQKMNWILISVFYDQKTFGDAVAMAKRFINGGERLFFLQEFLSPAVFFHGLFLWLIQTVKGVFLAAKFDADELGRNLSIPESEIFLRSLWYQSFAGNISMAGIFSYLCFKRAMRYMGATSPLCVYHAEMQSWEKALLAAAEREAGHLKTVGFQHTVVSKNYFSYFAHPSETRRPAPASGLPLPTVLACNGAMHIELLKPCEYPKVVCVEAIRHFHLNAALQNSAPAMKKNVLLVVGSIDKRGTQSLCSFVKTAFPKPEEFQIWFKAHPGQPLNDLDKSIFQTRNEPVDRLLTQVSMILVGDSSVALEALAYDCHVVLPFLSEAMFISPLLGHETFYSQISSPAELSAVVREKISTRLDEDERSRRRSLVRKFWELDESIPRWNALLKEAYQ